MLSRLAPVPLLCVNGVSAMVAAVSVLSASVKKMNRHHFVCSLLLWALRSQGPGAIDLNPP